jgi:hypothetical protein
MQPALATANSFATFSYPPTLQNELRRITRNAFSATQKYRTLCPSAKTLGVHLRYQEAYVALNPYPLPRKGLKICDEIVGEIPQPVKNDTHAIPNSPRPTAGYTKKPFQKAPVF